ncbi:MAG: phosphatidylserine/phosphatidylglycerophosphate/cardiolipin synthase family protein [Lentimicrobium sp.]|nr:phosphatidylserine/phosphatidylglycerophosphate/cardiolipin synthase family protein [Lentimicrobium sp.]
MTPPDPHKTHLYSLPELYHEAMLNDIRLARKSILLEIYRFRNDKLGVLYRDALAEKCAEGVRVKLLLDSWGTDVPISFFDPIIRQGGEVRFFKKIRFFVDFFTKNHRRNHRKLLIIDQRVTYIGSANLTHYSIKWRELMLRIEGPIAADFQKTFDDSFRIYNKYILNRFSYKKSIIRGSYEIVQDMPSIYRQLIKNRYEHLFSKAKQEIFIETPYFLPGYKLRQRMAKAAKRGVKVTILVPFHSDVRLVDFLRARYMEFYHKNKIHVFYYTPGNLHAKCVLVDNQTFAIGSANFDYRSFRYQHEIMLFGKNPEIVAQLRNHLNESMQSSRPFDYEVWLARPYFERVMGLLLTPFRHLF